MPVIISIIIPTFNRSGVIGAAIESIRKQSFQEWECIIVDDNSTDDTNLVIHRVMREDSRFSYLLNTRKKGAPGARNTGLLASIGKYVVFFDSDNTMHPDFLSKLYSAILQENVDIGGCFSSVIDSERRQRTGAFHWVGYGKIHGRIMRGKSYFDNSSTVIKKEKLFDVGLLDEDCPSYQEWDTHIRLSRISQYTTVEDELIDYYRGGEDTISKSLKRAVAGQTYILRKNKFEFQTRYPGAYLKFCFNLYCRVRMLPEGDDNVSSLIEYRSAVNGMVRILVRILYPFRRFLKSMKNNRSI